MIFLDARLDRYWMLPVAMSQALNRQCAGAELAGDEAAPLLALVRAGLLDSAKGEPLVPCDFPRARTSRLEVIDTKPGSSTMIAGLCFAASTWRIRRRGLGCELAGLQRRRERWSGTARHADRHAGAFARLRLLVSPAGNCLPLSLALARRCASTDARLVFGVQLNPFAAHAWVQRDTEVLNDELHVVHAFTPVLVI
ncbi:lasso peptide biosynthesis B2 protein [Sphingomonas sp. Leaf21]|uniref:lasso peptide biosynthesis B2 protein n=1 Tax=Sphingomonas sp. Leaf21 TaxID=2876550 RepID=UPI001E380F8A|nr:lasso peptide biosynthesis B2 protein [Sphingomonas sp. Leaf21]